MNTKQLDTVIRSEIDQFLTSISQLVRQAAVEAVKEALGATDGKVAGPARRGPGRPGKVARAPKAKAGKRGRRSSADVEAVGSKVLAYVKANPGSRLEEIGRGLKVDTAGLKRPIQLLIATGRLRTEGQKRGTKYFAGGGGKGGSKPKMAKRAGKKVAAKRAKWVGRRPAKKGARKSARKVSARPGGKKAGKRTPKTQRVTMTPTEPVLPA